MAGRTVTTGQQQSGDKKTITGISAEKGADDKAASAASAGKYTGFTAAKAGAAGPAPPKFDLTTPEGRESLRQWRQKKQAAIK